MRDAYLQGVREALSKYAGAADVLQTFSKSPNLSRNLNVAGLGLIAAPVIHSVLSHEDDSPGVARAKHLSDLAGLGLLIGTEFMKKH